MTGNAHHRSRALMGHEPFLKINGIGDEDTYIRRMKIVGYEVKEYRR